MNAIANRFLRTSPDVILLAIHGFLKWERSFLKVERVALIAFVEFTNKFPILLVPTGDILFFPLLLLGMTTPISSLILKGFMSIPPFKARWGQSLCLKWEMVLVSLLGFVPPLLRGNGKYPFGNIQSTLIFSPLLR